MIELPTLPYAYDALEPAISARTMELHHRKHHAAYVSKSNSLANANGLGGRDLADIVVRSSARGPTALYNNAAQAWNHGFFWRSMTPDLSAPSDDLTSLIQRTFGGLDAFKSDWVEAGIGHFGSGWLWLVWRNRALKIVTTQNARNFLARRDVTPLLVCDLWEHAYYLDHQNDRQAYLRGWIEDLANWSFADEELKTAPTEREDRSRISPDAPHLPAA